MSGSVWIIFWWLMFAISHMLIADRRSALIERLGKRPYLLGYTLISFATFIPLVMVYGDYRHGGGLLWTAPVWLQQVGMLLSLLGIAMMLPGALRPSPVGMVPGREPRASGLTRITRHPLFMGLGIWGLGHCLINGFLTDVLFFGGFALFAVIGCAHQDARKLREESNRLGSFYAETSLLPFVAIFSGRGKLALAEMPWIQLGIGLAIGYAVYRLHPWLFG